MPKQNSKEGNFNQKDESKEDDYYDKEGLEEMLSTFEKNVENTLKDSQNGAIKGASKNLWNMDLNIQTQIKKFQLKSQERELDIISVCSSRINMERVAKTNFHSQLGLMPNNARQKTLDPSRRLHYSYNEKYLIPQAPIEAKAKQAHSKVLKKLSKDIEEMMPARLMRMPRKINYTDLFVGKNQIVFKVNNEFRSKCLKTIQDSDFVQSAVDIARKRVATRYGKYIAPIELNQVTLSDFEIIRIYPTQSSAKSTTKKKKNAITKQIEPPKKRNASDNNTIFEATILIFVSRLQTQKNRQIMKIYMGANCKVKIRSGKVVKDKNINIKDVEKDIKKLVPSRSPIVILDESTINLNLPNKTEKNFDIIALTYAIGVPCKDGEPCLILAHHLKNECPRMTRIKRRK